MVCGSRPHWTANGAAAVFNSHERQEAKTMTTLQKRRTPRSVLRARHGINFRFDESSIMASLAGMVALAKLPEHER
jgi:hypothetical protein